MAGKPHQQFLLFAVVCLLALPNSQSKHPYQSDEIEVNDIEEADVDQEHESQSWESASEFEEQVQNQDSNTEDGFDILDSILESVKNVQQENEMDSELFSSEKILSIGEMKASLRKAGVSKTKLDNFLVRIYLLIKLLDPLPSITFCLNFCCCLFLLVYSSLIYHLNTYFLSLNSFFRFVG